MDDFNFKKKYFYYIGLFLIIFGPSIILALSMIPMVPMMLIVPLGILLTVLGLISIVLTIKFDSDPKKTKKILASADIIIGLTAILIGLWYIAWKEPIGLLLTGLGSALLVIVMLLFAPVRDKVEPVTETTKETDQEGKTKIIEKTTTLKWENYTKTERAFKLFGILIIIFGLSFVIWLGLIETDSLKGIGIIGLGSFVVVLAGAFCLSDEWNLNAGEFRKALTISIISVYFSTLAFSNKIITYNVTNSTEGNLTNVVGFVNANGSTTIIKWTLVEPVFNNLWAIVLAVIIFYFAKEWIPKLKGN